MSFCLEGFFYDFFHCDRKRWENAVSEFMWRGKVRVKFEMSMTRDILLECFDAVVHVSSEYHRPLRVQQQKRYGSMLFYVKFQV